MKKQYSVGEEIANCIIHGAGALFAIVGLTILLVLSSLKGDLSHIIGYSIYGISLIFLYVSSTLYHAIPFEKPKQIFKTLDHIGIFFLIAGTYTPILLLNLEGPWSIGLLITIWTLAVFGTVFKLFSKNRFSLISTFFYILMGWVAVFGFKPLTDALNNQAVGLIVAGGIVYTAGVAFYLMKSIRYHHAVWHIFVLAGSVLHFMAIVSAADF